MLDSAQKRGKHNMSDYLTIMDYVLMKKIFVLILVLMLVAVGCSSSDDEPTPMPSGPRDVAFSAEDPAQVLRLDSYHPENIWSREINAGVIGALADAGYSETASNLVIDYFYMDTKRNTGEAYFATVAQDAIAYIRENQPDVVIASDNNAIRLVVQAMLEDDVNFVFNGLNDAPAQYGLAGHPRVTGVLERAHVTSTMRWIETVFPEAEQITCLFDDSVTSNAYLPAVESALAVSNLVDSPVHRTNSFEEWQRLVQDIDEASVALLVGTYHTLQDADGSPIHENDVIQWTTENTRLPVVALWEFSIPFGALGGSVISGETQGQEAGEKAAAILSGTAPGDIPITTPLQGKLVLNQQKLGELDIVIPITILANSEIYDPDTE